MPTFASDRDVALEGDPDCIRGPEAGSPCSKDEGTSNVRPYGEDSLKGQGTRTSAQVDTLVFGASLGVAFPLQVGKRQIRIKPSVGWINYKLEAEGLVVDGACDPVAPFQCTDVYNASVPPQKLSSGFLRPTILSGSKSHRFNGIGPGVEVEVDTGRFGPLGVWLFLGGGAYAILGDRTIAFGASQTYDDRIGMDRATAAFEVEVDPWIYRGHVGIRFQWLGSAN